MNSYPLLLSPITIGRYTVSNRIVMPPMVIFKAKEDGSVTQTHLEHYRSSAGPGLVIVEGTAVSSDGRISRNQLGIYRDIHIKGLARIADIIHSNGAVAGIQIHHAGAKAFQESRKNKRKNVGLMFFKLLRQQFAVSSLVRIRDDFKNAARRASDAGFDIIEIHGAHGYLFTQFLSPLTNWRLDRYGGNIDGRGRLIQEVFNDIHKTVAERSLITCRLGVADGRKRGLTLQEGLSIAVKWQQEGLKLLDVSNGSGIPGNIVPEGSPFSARLHLAKAVKSSVSIPVIGGGGIRHPDLAEQALRDGMADLIYVGKGLLADPQWARKTIENRAEAIVPCIACNQCYHFIDYSRCPARRKYSS
jgi:NADPH2 dehydrogenase